MIRYQGGMSGVDNRGNLVASMRELYKSMDKAPEGFPPLMFWQVRAHTGICSLPFRKKKRPPWRAFSYSVKSFLNSHKRVTEAFLSSKTPKNVGASWCLSCALNCPPMMMVKISLTGSCRVRCNPSKLLFYSILFYLFSLQWMKCW